jgi:hypothetical protein
MLQSLKTLFGPTLTMVCFFLGACPNLGGDDHPCVEENHCLRVDGELECEDGYTWEDPADADNYNCVSISGFTSEGKCTGDLNLTNPGTLDLDVKRVNIGGQVTVNGSALPTKSQSRGSIYFLQNGTDSGYSLDLEINGAFSYNLTLAPGTYSISYVPNSSLCNADPSGIMPCTGGIVLGNVKITADGNLDVDMRTALVSGNVTVGGGNALPVVSQSRGSLSFYQSDGGAAANFDIGSSGPYSYQRTLLVGTYDILYGANSECNGNNTPFMPCNSGVIRKGVSITTDGNLDVDIPRVTVNGVVTLNGGDFPTGQRGSLYFSYGPGGGGLSLPTFGAANPLIYSAALLPGEYEIRHIASGDSACHNSGIPCNDQIVAGCISDDD